MLTTFSSKAASDVSMLTAHAQDLLGQMGKADTQGQGIFTPEEIPAAIAALDHFCHDWDAQHPPMPEVEQDPFDDALQRAAIPMRTRAQPVLAMLRAAVERGAFVTWFAHEDGGGA
jgi:hypothetical protein